MSLLDDESSFPGATDETLITKFHQWHSTNPGYEKSARNKMNFAVQHYAGKVVYTAQQFLEKNSDVLNDTVLDLFARTKNARLASWFAAELQASSIRSTIKRGYRPPTVGGQFKVRRMTAAARPTSPAARLMTPVQFCLGRFGRHAPPGLAEPADGQAGKDGPVLYPVHQAQQGPGAGPVRVELGAGAAPLHRHGGDHPDPRARLQSARVVRRVLRAVRPCAPVRGGGKRRWRAAHADGTATLDARAMPGQVLCVYAGQGGGHGRAGAGQMPGHLGRRQARAAGLPAGQDDGQSDKRSQPDAVQGWGLG